MLGQMVNAYFSAKNCNVVSFDVRFLPDTREAYNEFLGKLRNAVVFNCAGRIKQKTEDVSDLLFVNSILPADLRNLLHEDVVLINPSTDCVFDGKKGAAYDIGDFSNAFDGYGWSKRLGEVVLFGRPNTIVPRVSIVGPDANPEGKGLMAWVLAQKGNTVKGFANHLWNGITTLEWCKQIDEFLVRNGQFDFQLLHFGTAESYSKYDMLVLFDEVFDLGLTVEQFETPEPVDRRLLPQIVSKPLPEQLEELKQFIAETEFWQ